MLTLYDFKSSGNGYKVRLLLHQLRQPFIYLETNILKGGEPNSAISGDESKREGPNFSFGGRSLSC